MTNGAYPVKQEDVEAGLLNAVGQNMSLWTETYSSFTSDDFIAHRDIFHFIASYLAEYGSLPSHGQISTRFNWQPTIGDFPYWYKEMERYVRARQVLEAIKEGYDKIADPTESLNVMLQKLSIIRSHMSNHVQASDASAEERLVKFDARTEYVLKGGNMIGLPTGMSIIDDTRVGWTAGSLVGLYARPGIGKTWWLMWQGINTWIKGGVVLAITPEMPANMLNLRIDTIAGAALGFPLDYQKLQQGDPSGGIRENYEEVVKIMSKSQRWWTYDSMEDHAMRIEDFASLIRQHRPSIVLIDNLSSFLGSIRGGAGWEQMRELMSGLKNIGTVSEVPIIITHHARRIERRGDDDFMPSLNDAAYGDAFVTFCSDIITMVPDNSMNHLIWYAIRKHRERGWRTELPVRMGMAVDFSKGKIIDLSYLGHNPEAVGAEARRLLNL